MQQANKLETFELPFFNSSISAESLLAAVILVATFEATVTTDGARGGTKCPEVAAGEAGDPIEVRMVDSGGGAGATKPERETMVSVIVPEINKLK